MPRLIPEQMVALFTALFLTESTNFCYDLWMDFLGDGLYYLMLVINC